MWRSPRIRRWIEMECTGGWIGYADLTTYQACLLAITLVSPIYKLGSCYTIQPESGVPPLGITINTGDASLTESRPETVHSAVCVRRCRNYVLVQAGSLVPHTTGYSWKETRQ